MATVESNGITIEYDLMGDPGAPPLLMIMGLGAQLIDWPDEFCTRLAARGYHLIRFDNRDSGLSGGLDDHGPPDLAAVFGGDVSSVPYRIADMAADAAGVLEALNTGPAHVVGVSMGGMIAQQLTLDRPDLVRSLCSVMSTTGDRAVGHSAPEAFAALQQPPARDAEQAIANTMLTSRTIGSPGYPPNEEELLRRATAKITRAYRPAGSARQLGAVLASPDRTEALAAVRVPTAVLHGESDKLIDVSGGRATAAAIPGAELVTFPGMGHDLPAVLYDKVIDAIDANARRAT